MSWILFSTYIGPNPTTPNEIWQTGFQDIASCLPDKGLVLGWMSNKLGTCNWTSPDQVDSTGPLPGGFKVFRRLWHDWIFTPLLLWGEGDPKFYTRVQTSQKCL